ncbi:MAG: exonuclease domain-containing protein [Cyclobacteriaceae bacterium]|nr:exonuclease domain-containing protein [Cyclobacteriaceae bacterium]MCX7637662.1 exonuclease domain-containing protein [Cyclobacteriaceae bacterium]MDW8332403.1 exonuclease domain-containing protein [Cyclobacteriaceae bacterium]
MFAVVDIETTGGYAEYHRITEIAIYHHDGKSITDFYYTLINPGRRIPSFITGLTGITTDMVEDAPAFEEIAEDILRLLEGRIFVAHNAHFDYSFLKKEFEIAGIRWQSKKLCTVRLSRKLIPGLRSYSLGSLAEALGIPVHNRHRAGGDAEATAHIFTRLLQRDKEGYVQQLLKRNSGETILPPNLSRWEFDRLPATTGIYYFLNNRNQVIYVGKAQHIRRRVAGHFTGVAQNWSRSKIRNEIHHVHFEQTGCELIALIREAEEIRRHWPKYNQAQKYKVEEWGIFSYEDRNGYLRLLVNMVTRNSRPIIRFSTKGDAWNFLWKKVSEYELCMRLAGLQEGNQMCSAAESGSCHGACLGKEKPEPYNKRVQAMISSINDDFAQPVLLLGKGRTNTEYAVVMVENGHRIYYGFVSKRPASSQADHLRKKLKPAMDIPAVQQIVHSYLTNPRDMDVLLL